ncbi:hypothetical protein PLICRDRAFT_32475 [Plicaturopsis crispa FD-325 SS-3]|uniref:Protein kinase domain-containing protein n=1 Tax=Plicaturopsis crispa FD-325 SS-3 TaxID=944288 RepID=A0A0C9T8E3_PLICR|nr:hypothetical protein PLICRDRAFT_32475 [Plicaturopsis crispa FD-325 SS-3]
MSSAAGVIGAEQQLPDLSRALSNISWGEVDSFVGKEDVHVADMQKMSLYQGKVTLKVFRVTLTASHKIEAFLDDMRDVVGTLVELCHPNVVPIFGTYYVPPHPPGIVSPYYQNGTVVQYRQFMSSRRLLRAVCVSPSGFSINCNCV